MFFNRVYHSLIRAPRTLLRRKKAIIPLKSVCQYVRNDLRDYSRNVFLHFLHICTFSWYIMFQINFHSKSGQMSFGDRCGQITGPPLLTR